MSYKDNSSSSSDEDEEEDNDMEIDPQIPSLNDPLSGTGSQQIGHIAGQTAPASGINRSQRPSLRSQFPPPGRSAPRLKSVIGQYTIAGKPAPASGLKISQKPSLRSQFPPPGRSAPRLKSVIGQYTIGGKIVPVSGLKRSRKSDLPDPKRRPPQPQPTSSQMTSRIPTTQSIITRPSIQLSGIVQKYRDPLTGEPDLNLMRKHVFLEREQIEDPSRPSHEILAERHKRRALDIKRETKGRSQRQRQHIETKGYRFDPNTGRFIKEGGTTVSQMTTTPTATASTGRQRPQLERSQSMPDLSALGEVSGKISEMGEQRQSQIMPTGRLGYGMRWSPELSRRFSADDSSLTTGKFHGEDISSYTPKERAFSLRLKQRPDDELELYRQYRNMADPMHKDQAVARKRMPHLSSQYGRCEADVARVKDIRKVQNKLLHMDKPPDNYQGVRNMRQYRRFMTNYQRSTPSMRVEDTGYPPKWLDPIEELPQETSDDSQKQYETYDQRFQHELHEIKERSIPTMFGQIREEEEEEEEQQQQQQQQQQSEEPMEEDETYEQWLNDYQQRQARNDSRDKSPEPPSRPDSCPTQ